MSTARDRISKENQDRVIIRGFRDRPAGLTIVEIRDKVVDVIGGDPSLPMPFHLERAFAFDDSLYSQLTSAFESNDAVLLKELWSHAAPLAH